MNQKEVLEEALKIKVDGTFLFDVFQVTYNVFDQSLKGIIKEVNKQEKLVVVKEALANGRVFPSESYSQYSTMYSVLSKLANKYNVGIDAIALAFCLQTVPVDVVLSGASNVKHVSENILAQNVTLQPSEIVEIEKLKVSPTEYWNERKQLQWQ